jgi:hypothetical protein
MSSLRNRVNKELQALIEQHGTLKQQQVVEAARKKGTALYAQFDREGLWDDTVAAKRARLEFASRLIRLYTIRLTDDQASPVRALVSLKDDRTVESGTPGYRALKDVLADDDLRENLIQTALMDLRAVKRKHEQLKELINVWSAIEAADAAHAKPQAAKKEKRPAA